MLQREITTASEGFDKKLEKLRTRIDFLPESQRSHLYELADTIKQQRRWIKKHEHANIANG